MDLNEKIIIKNEDENVPEVKGEEEIDWKPRDVECDRCEYSCFYSDIMQYSEYYKIWLCRDCREDLRNYYITNLTDWYKDNNNYQYIKDFMSKPNPVSSFREQW
jgi:hypothetical protein